MADGGKRKAANGTSGKHSSSKAKVHKPGQESSFLSPYLHKEDFKARFTDAFRKQQAFNENGTVVYTKPFECCYLPNFIADEQFLESLKQELEHLEFYEKSNDLYKFHQSDDLWKSSRHCISSLRAILYQEFRSWLEEISGMTLAEQVDMSCAKYQYTDVLLCHDDELEDRKIAYILYLVPPWNKEDGGTLDLFSVDENGQPDKITESLVPMWNSLVFFEVTPVSFHQVSEVLSADKTRLSISGWFHGETLERPLPYEEPLRDTIPPQPLEDDVLVEWVNPLYLDEETVAQIRERFEEESEIQLDSFLLEEKYLEILRVLSSEGVKWEDKGPANKRCLKCAHLPSAPAILTQLMKLLQSQPMFKLLRMLTGLDLADLPLTDEEHENEGASEKTVQRNPRSYGDVRHFTHGCYTLVHDSRAEGEEYALDAMLTFGGEGWTNEYGGFTTYLASGEDEELLTVFPQENALALVYRDKETVRFVKHVTHRSVSTAGASKSADGFYDVSLVYFE